MKPEKVVKINKKSSAEYKPTTKIWLPYQPKLEDFDPTDINNHKALISAGFKEFQKKEKQNG
jgi:hypothetical protein